LHSNNEESDTRTIIGQLNLAKYDNITGQFTSGNFDYASQDETFTYRPSEDIHFQIPHMIVCDKLFAGI